MNAIRLYSAELSDQVSKGFAILVRGSEKNVEDFLPIELGEIDRNATECFRLAEVVEAKFENVMDLTGELLEVSAAAKGYYNQIRKTLIQGIKALASVREQWQKLVEVFQFITSSIKVCPKQILSSIFEYVNDGQKRGLAKGYASSDFMRDLINEQVRQANATFYVVWSLSNTYVEISRDHLMSRIASLGHLIALDPEKERDAIEAKLNELMEGSQEAQEAIRKYVSEAKDHFHEKMAKRVKKIQTELLKASPSF